MNKNRRRSQIKPIRTEDKSAQKFKDVATTVVQIAAAVTGMFLVATGQILPGAALVATALAGGARGNLVSDILGALTKGKR